MEYLVIIEPDDANQGAIDRMWDRIHSTGLFTRFVSRLKPDTQEAELGWLPNRVLKYIGGERDANDIVDLTIDIISKEETKAYIMVVPFAHSQLHGFIRKA